jgi:hypothetical protein
MAEKHPALTNVNDPKLWTDPRTISLAQLQRYYGIEHAKLNSSYKNYRSSLLYLGLSLD